MFSFVVVFILSFSQISSCFSSFVRSFDPMFLCRSLWYVVIVCVFVCECVFDTLEPRKRSTLRSYTQISVASRGTCRRGYAINMMVVVSRFFYTLPTVIVLVWIFLRCYPFGLSESIASMCIRVCVFVYLTAERDR